MCQLSNGWFVNLNTWIQLHVCCLSQATSCQISSQAKLTNVWRLCIYKILLLLIFLFFLILMLVGYFCQFTWHLQQRWLLQQVYLLWDEVATCIWQYALENSRWWSWRWSVGFRRCIHFWWSIPLWSCLAILWCMNNRTTENTHTKTVSRSPSSFANYTVLYWKKHN